MNCPVSSEGASAGPCCCSVRPPSDICPAPPMRRRGSTAQCPADQAEHHNRAHAEAAGTTRSHPATIFNALASRHRRMGRLTG
jgi:hypothetical protein